MNFIIDYDGEMDALDKLHTQLRKLKVGSEGFSWVAEAYPDGGGDYLVTPVDDNMEKLDQFYKDAAGNEYLPDLVAQAVQAPEGSVGEKRLSLVNPVTGNTEEMVLNFVYYQPLRWVIGTALPANELYATSRQIDAAFGKMNLAVILATLILLGMALVAALFVAKAAIRPIRKVQEMANQMALGHLDMRLNMGRSDELGEMAAAMDAFAEDLQTQVVGSLQRLAGGDLTFTITPKDENDQIRGAIKKLEEDLNRIMQQILSAGDQIAAGSSQVSESAQALSEGATRSAASIEEISASMGGDGRADQPECGKCRSGQPTGFGNDGSGAEGEPADAGHGRCHGQHQGVR